MQGKMYGNVERDMRRTDGGGRIKRGERTAEREGEWE